MPWLERDKPARAVDGKRHIFGLDDAINCDDDTARDRLLHLTSPGCMRAAVGLRELEDGRRSISRADQLVCGGGHLRRRAGFPIGMIAPAKSIEPTAPFLEKADDGVQVVQCLDAVTRIIASSGISPAAVPLLMARTQHDDFGAPFRTADRAARN